MKKSNRAVVMSLALIGIASIATGCGKKDEDSAVTSQSKSSPGTAPASVKSSNGQPQQAPKQGPAAKQPE